VIEKRYFDESARKFLFLSLL